MEKLYAYLRVLGLMFVFGMITFWLVYFFSLDVFVTDDSSNRVFVNSVSLISAMYYLGILGFGVLLFFSKRKLFKTVSLLITLPTALSVIYPIFFADSTTEFSYNLSNVIALSIVLFSFILAPVLTMYFIKPRNSFLYILAVTSILLCISVLFSDSTFIEVVSTRWGGFNSKDLFYILVQLPFLLYIAYISLYARKLRIFAK